MDDVELSVVVPVYNEAGRLREVLDELLAELGAGGRTLEVVVVDDGSTDGSTSCGALCRSGSTRESSM